MNKIFVFWGISLAAILIVENMVTWTTAYIFISNGWTWFLGLVSAIIWIFIWWWFRWMLEKDNSDDENYDF
jgi:hypothetical protein